VVLACGRQATGDHEPAGVTVTPVMRGSRDAPVAGRHGGRGRLPWTGHGRLEGW
jgi:hypothetical protein